MSRASDVFQKEYPKILDHLLNVYARAGFVWPLWYPWGFYSHISGFSDHLASHMAALFLGALACTSLPCDHRGSNCFGGTYLLRPGEYYPCILFSSYHDREGLDGLNPLSLTGLIFPKVPNLFGGYLKFSEVLLHDCKRRSRKSTPCLQF